MTFSLAGEILARTRIVDEVVSAAQALAMGLSGKPNLAAIDSSLVKVHRW